MLRFLKLVGTRTCASPDALSVGAGDADAQANETVTFFNSADGRNTRKKGSVSFLANDNRILLLVATFPQAAGLSFANTFRTGETA